MNNMLRITKLALLLVTLQPMTAMAGKAMPDATLTGHTDVVTGLKFSPDGKRLASISDDGQLKIWDLENKKELFSIDDARPGQLRFTPDSKAILGLSKSGGILEVDVETGKAKTVMALPDMQSGPTAIDVSADGKSIAVVGRSALSVYDLITGGAKAQYEVHSNYGIPAVAFSPDGTRVATASTDHTSLVLEVATGKITNTLDLNLNGVAVTFSRDGKKVITFSSDGMLRSFDIESGNVVELTDKGAENMTMDLSKDGQTLVLGGSGRAPWTVSLSDGKLHDDLFDSEQFVRSAAISADGKWIAGGSNPGPIYLWKRGN